MFYNHCCPVKNYKYFCKAYLLTFISVCHRRWLKAIEPQFNRLYIAPTGQTDWL